MDPLGFFREKAVQRILDRAAQAASTPVSIHFHHEGEEGARVFGTGRCEACQYVSSLSGGRMACRASRTKAANQARAGDDPVTFLCHLGFACVIAPVLPMPDAPYMVTFGPYCPAEAPQLLEQDALNGLRSLRTGHETFPVPLNDIAVAKAPAVPAVVEWLLEALAVMWGAANAADAVVSPPPVAAPKARGRPKQVVLEGNLPGRAVAVAVAAGNQPQATRILRDALGAGKARPDVGALRGRTLAMAGAVIEALEQAGQPTEGVWDGYAAFAEAVRQSQTGSECLRALLTLFGPALRVAKAAGAGDDVLGVMNQMIADRLMDGITLDEIGRRLNRHPSAIAHQLQRKFGLTFSQYVGRLRVEQAKELLRRTRLSVGEVGQRVGIDDQSNFSKLFRRFEGCSPQMYRDQFRK